MKRLLLILCAMLVGTSFVCAQYPDFSAVNSDGETIYYKITDAINHEVEVTQYSNGRYIGVINIPASVTYHDVTYSVTGIGGGYNYSSDTYLGAFYFCRGLISVTIPNSVTTIGSYAFAACSIMSVAIPNSVTTIESCAFQGCSGLTSITIGNSVTTIGYGAFDRCSGLTSVTIPNSVTIIGMDAFYGCSGLMSVTIGNSVTTVGRSAFGGCSGLTSVTIPNSVTTIGDYAFGGCSGLTSITIGGSVTTIGESAFGGCSGLTSVTIGNSVTTIGKSAFMNDSNLHTVYWNAKNVTAYGYTDRYNDVHHPFENSPIETVIFGNLVQKIPYQAFKDCTTLESVVIGNSVTTIGTGAFEGCSDLTSVTIPNSVTEIGTGAFENCSGLTSVTIPNSVTTIKSRAFYKCSGLTSVTIPNSVTEIGRRAFVNDSNLHTVYWNAKNVTSYWDHPFEDSPIETVIFGDSVQTIPSKAFENCITLDSLMIGSSVDTIGDYAFSGTAITSINIPNSVANIGQEAFYGCTRIQQINVETRTPPTLGLNVFQNVRQTIPVYVPCEVLSAYQNNLDWNYFTNIQCDGVNVYAITVMSSNSNWGTVMGDGEYEEGATVTLTATANEECRFMSWTDGNRENPRSVVVTSDSMFIAIFEEISTMVRHTIMVKSNNNSWGTVTGGGEYQEGESVLLTATANEGYRFVSWNDGVTTNPRIITVREDVIYKATFEAIPTTVYYTMMVMSNNNSWGTVTGGGEYEEGETATLKAIAKNGYHFVQWDDGNIDNPRTIIVIADATYIATFAEDEPEEIEGVDELAGVRVYPNPTSGMICVEGDEVDRVEVLDMLGVKVMEVEDCSKVDLSELESGVYVLRIFVGDEAAVRRVVKR